MSNQTTVFDLPRPRSVQPAWPRRTRPVRNARLGVLAVFAFFLSIGTPLVAAQQQSPESDRPNVIYIMTDQQHAGMLSCAGNTFLKTPALDSLAARGVRFELAYCSNPVCVPSRVSMMTGHYPSRFGVRTNSDSRNTLPPEARQQSLGRVFRNAGYETAYGGKTHWINGMTPESIGFTYLTRDRRGELAEACAEFIKRPHERPFLLVASFINPHDICYMMLDEYARATNQPIRHSQAREERRCLAEALQLPEGVTREDFFARLCPRLPENFAVPGGEPPYVNQVLGASRRHARENWSEEKWRLHRWAYCRLTERVDRHIGRVLAALKEAGLEERTVVVFSSDHGDLDAAHRLEHKSFPYEEAARVPLIVSFPGHTPRGRVDREHLIVSGVDLLPTLCDFADIEPPKGLPGRSIRPLAEGREPDDWRDQVVVESAFARMVRTARYKYIVYQDGPNREQLIDLQEDPGEMVNLAGDPAHEELLNEMRARLARWVDDYGDRIGRAYLVRPKNASP